MAKIMIEGIEYETDGLSDNGKAQLASLQFLEAQMHKLRNEIAVYTTAKKGYIEALKAAAAAGYEVIVIDSLSHAWMGKDGALELVDRAAARSKSGNSFGAWREVTPQHNAMVEAIITSPCHVICTMRSKTEYVQDKDERGKTVIRKVGLQPVQRDGMEYEFDVVGDIDHDHKLVVTKSRIPALSDAVINKPGAEFAGTLRNWLESGAEPAAPAPVIIPSAPIASSAPATPEQLEQIKALHAAAGLPASYWDTVRQTYSIASSRNLTQDQAAVVIKDLETIRNERKGS